MPPTKDIGGFLFMYFNDSRKLLIYFALKYDGDYSKIITALELHEELKVTPEEVEKACSTVKSKVMTILDYDYPLKLKNSCRPPIVLFYYGDITLLDDRNHKYGVVGSRDCTEYGVNVTNYYVSDMAKGTVLVSGMARGIDTVGHLAQIRNGGRTIAVLGSGIDNCYPPENYKLYKELKKKHLVISEYPNMSEPAGYHFPIRNRIVTALSDALLVPQVRSQFSGTMSSINMMAEMSKPIFVVPTPFTEDAINNEILLEGAFFAKDGKEIIKQLKWD